MSNVFTTLTDREIGDLVKKTFILGLTKAPEDNVTDFFFVRPKQDWSQDRIRLTEFDRERMGGVKPELEKTQSKTAHTGYSKEIIRKVIAVKKSISGEQAKVLSAVGLKNYALETSSLIREKIDTDLRNIFSFGLGTSYTDNYGYTVDTTTGDGKAIFANNHTLASKPGTVYSNLATGNPVFSEDALTGLETYFRNEVVSNYGDLVDIKPNTIVTTDDPRTVKQVRRLLTSIAPVSIDGVTNANSGVMNPDKGRYTHKIVNMDIDMFGARDITKSRW